LEEDITGVRINALLAGRFAGLLCPGIEGVEKSVERVMFHRPRRMIARQQKS
jgi:hypothetical protein